MRVFQFVIKKKKEKGPETDFLFLKMILTFFKSILILIITSIAVHYSQNVSRGFFYLGVHRSTGVFSWLFFQFFTPSLARDSLSGSPRVCLCLTENGEKLRLFFTSRPPQ